MRVRVVAQSIGGLLDYVNEMDGPEDARITDEHRILVVVPGFYSLAWVLVEPRLDDRLAQFEVLGLLACLLARHGQGSLL